MMSDKEKQETARRWAKQMAYIWAEMFSNQNTVGTQPMCMGNLRRAAIMLDPGTMSGYCSPGNVQQILKDAQAEKEGNQKETPKAKAESVTWDNDREALEARAKELGIKTSKRMKDSTVAAKIAEAENGD
jgi:hypothetical protein